MSANRQQPTGTAIELSGFEPEPRVPLAASFSTLLPLMPGCRLWGREYLTIALLANNPSLDELAAQADTSPEALRDAWLSSSPRTASADPP